MAVDALLLALTGERVPLNDGTIADRLAAIGWDLERVREFRAARSLAGQSWPVAVTADDLPGGFAAFMAELVEARAELGLMGSPVVGRADRPFNADERRLLADRPPHWA